MPHVPRCWSFKAATIILINWSGVLRVIVMLIVHATVDPFRIEFIIAMQEICWRQTVRMRNVPALLSVALRIFTDLGQVQFPFAPAQPRHLSSCQFTVVLLSAQL